MAKNLVIVESPAKAKTIEGFLGKEYTVKSSYGHYAFALDEKAYGTIKEYIATLERHYLMRELQELERQYPEMADPESPTQRVGSDLSKGCKKSVNGQY